MGLKHNITVQDGKPVCEPQSNQRGIETVVPEGGRRGQPEPQSNQRGIETILTWSDWQEMKAQASIEPAWD